MTPPTHPFDMTSLQAALRAVLPSLRASDASVIRAVLDEPEFVQTASTAEVAERAGVSNATVVRAARAAGFTGFSDLKFAVARASGGAGMFVPPPRLTDIRTPHELVESILSSHVSVVEAVRGTLDGAVLQNAVEAVNRAGRILVSGSGTSAAVAADAAFRFSSIGLMVQAPVDHLSTLVVARLLRPSDVLLIVSHTGITPQTVAVADAARHAGATVVAITSFTASPLVDVAEHVLVAGGSELDLQLAQSSSRLAHLTVVDMLHAGVALADMERTRRAESMGFDTPAADHR
ncbi:MurR/RpiR family transcriptional regulator [Rhodococcus sp. NPDC057297]|jgi:RpiR family carbohydrate utilization transcriptional regulator|uniref:MurR/RpiR family transcriptional regulator n=1 Tax=Rhodococcus sp. NPDC057297 TaxID=3346090 RepID=UPI0036458E2E